MAGFTELEVWKESYKFRLEIDKLFNKFPKSEDYLLTNQIKRSSRSITATIAERHERFHYKENIQFCRQARGSIEETKDF